MNDVQAVPAPGGGGDKINDPLQLLILFPGGEGNAVSDFA